MKAADRTARWVLRMTQCTVVTAVVSWGTPASAQCAQAARLGGDAQLVPEVARALAARGIATSADSACAPIDVEVSPSEGGVRVVLVRGAGAPMERSVERVLTAALLIESWTEAGRLDLLEPATDARSEPPTDAVVAPIEEPAPVVAAAPAQPARPSPIATLHALGEAAFGNDASTWFGVRLGACGHAGPTCIGGSLRYLSDSGLTEGTATGGEQRVYLGADALLEVPIDVGSGVTLAPAITLGLGWLRMTVAEGLRSVNADVLRALVGGSFAAAVEMVDWLALELAAAVSWSPLARQAAWLADGLSVDPDPVVFGSVSLGLRMVLR